MSNSTPELKRLLKLIKPWHTYQAAKLGISLRYYRDRYVKELPIEKLQHLMDQAEQLELFWTKVGSLDDKEQHELMAKIDAEIMSNLFSKIING